MKDDFKKAAAQEIDVFKSEFRRRNPGADVDKLTDEDLLREVMNTVGKRGRLGEHVRCVRSEEHTSELQSLMRISYAVFCLKKKKHYTQPTTHRQQQHIH